VLRPGCSVAILDFNNAADNAVGDAAQGGGRGCGGGKGEGAWGSMIQRFLLVPSLHVAPVPSPSSQAFFLESLVVPAARSLGVAEEYE
jgi:hypothetical protein